MVVPSLVALIAENYKGKQQATAVGALGSARAGAGVAAFLVGGILGTFIGWRPAFGILIAVSALVFLLSFRPKPDQRRPDVEIDLMGVLLAAAAILLISVGFNNLNGWGLGLATSNAPFNVLGLSPARKSPRRVVCLTRLCVRKFGRRSQDRTDEHGDVAGNPSLSLE